MLPVGFDWQDGRGAWLGVAVSRWDSAMAWYGIHDPILDQNAIRCCRQTSAIICLLSGRCVSSHLTLAYPIQAVRRVVLESQIATNDYLYCGCGTEVRTDYGVVVYSRPTLVQLYLGRYTYLASISAWPNGANAPCKLLVYFCNDSKPHHQAARSNPTTEYFLLPTISPISTQRIAIEHRIPSRYSKYVRH